MPKNVVKKLILWYLEHKRDLPWRNTTDPYKIWISEIILQQTRVEQGLPYYHRFVTQYPEITGLANATDDAIMKLWQGLGYYSRARNLLVTARYLRDHRKSKFPHTYDEIRALKGIGDYTAAAIASFAYKLKHPVLDGNVYRLITRLYGIETPIDKPETKKVVLSILDEMMGHAKDSALLNQAMMEFGAMHCTPKNPKCEICPFLEVCYAFKEKKVSVIPVKGKALTIRNRYLNYFIFITPKQTTFITKRSGKDIWQDLFEFPLIETPKPVSQNKILKHPQIEQWIKGLTPKILMQTKPVLHKLSHQNLYVTFYVIQTQKRIRIKNSAIFEIEIENLKVYAIPRVIDRFLHLTGYLKKFI